MARQERRARLSACVKFRNVDFASHYVELGTLGEGKFAKVTLIEDVDDGELYALKRWLKSDPHPSRELTIVRRLTENDCPNVVQYCDHFLVPKEISRQTDSYLNQQKAMVTNYIQGLTLREFIDERKELDDVMLYGFLRSALEALVHCHTLKIVHKDLKPENILVVLPTSASDEGCSDMDCDYEVSEGKRKRSSSEMENCQLYDENNGYKLILIDFGLAELIDSGADIEAEDAGTPNYYSPAMIKAARGEIDFDAQMLMANDIWCLGASLFELCTNEKIAYYDTDSDNYEESWDSIMRFRVPKSVYGGNTVLNEIIKACLTKNHLKTPSATTLLNRLLTFYM